MGTGVIRAECTVGLRQSHTKSHQLHREEGCSMPNGRTFSSIHEVWVGFSALQTTQNKTINTQA